MMKTLLVCVFIGIVALSMVNAQDPNATTLAPNSTTHKGDAVGVHGSSLFLQIFLAVTGVFIFRLLEN